MSVTDLPLLTARTHRPALPPLHTEGHPTMTADTPVRHLDFLPLDDVVPAARNPKGHDLDGIQRSITRFGFVSPAVIDQRTGRMVAGHGRVLALRAMRDAGQSPPAGVQLDADAWMVPMLVGWSSRSDAEAEAFLVADNEWTVRGGWDDAGLGQMLADIAEADPDLMAVTGFTEDDLSKLLTGGDAPDDFPAFDDETIDTEHTCPKCGYAWSGSGGNAGEE